MLKLAEEEEFILNLSLFQSADLSSALLNYLEGPSSTESGKYPLYFHEANNHNDNYISRKSLDSRVK
jgi:hypothetical protein